MLTIRPDKLDLRPGDRVLDLGCGRGRHTYAFYWSDTPLKVTGLDLSEEEVKATADGFFDLPPPPHSPLRSATLTAGDAAKLPFKDGAFDAVVCSEVLEHVPDPVAVLDEIVRITRPGGRVALSVPRYWPEKICWDLSTDYHNTPGGHVRIFREEALRGSARRAGLRFFARHWAHALHSPYWWLQCAVWHRKDHSRTVAAYRRFLEWDLMKRPWLTRGLEAALNPVMGKSLVVYFHRPAQ